MFQKPDPKQSFPKLEEEVLQYWKKEKIFEKSLQKNKARDEYVFYDGPPFATGLPHYGHILAGTLKDVVPRYQTMRGYYVPRRWGWDCHGLPVENLVEQELNLKDKKALEEFGISNFNEACRSSVLRYVKEWGKIVERMGRWVDFEDSYKTMDTSFMESTWWVFKSLWDKGLIYKGKKPMHICPRCETPLSNFEVGLGYKDVKDPSVIWKFELADEPKTYLLAWTTTPWSTLGTMGLSVNPEVTYVKISPRPGGVPSERDNTHGIASSPLSGASRNDDECYIFAKERLEFVVKDQPYQILAEMKGSELVGKAYRHIFEDYKNLPELRNNKNVYHVFAGDYVEVTEGTGIVTINGAYGEIDFNAAKKNKLPILMDVEMNGKFKDFAGPFAGMYVKDAEKKMVEYFGMSGMSLRAPSSRGEAIPRGKDNPRNDIFRTEPYVHSYPHCWRCDTPLLNYATSSWYVDVEKIKQKMIKNNQKINWIPEHIKNGRFGKWLENARDWAISRNRYWGTPLPIWEAVASNPVRSEVASEGRLGTEEGVTPFGGEKRTTECLGSLADLRARIPKRFTKITVVRHGQSEGNVLGLRQSNGSGTPLTELGKKQVRETAEKLKIIHEQESFHRIFYSPLKRTEETAKIIAGSLPRVSLQAEPAVREIDFGELDGRRDTELKELTKMRHGLSPEDHFHARMGNTGESHADVARRALEFVQRVIQEYPGESILIISHSDFIRFLLREVYGQPLELIYSRDHFPQGAFKELYFDNKTGKLVDLHKHFVDELTYHHPKTGELMKRVPEVLDCWFEDGSMPYSQMHYPFENKERFEVTFPANFIAEGLDQTRGWFYTLMVLSTALFNEPAFHNIIVNGIVLAEDGQKMSKRKKNYPDPLAIFNSYGVDAMRIYLMHSPVVKADDLRFSEKGVEEVVRTTLLPLWNAYSFLMTYAEIDGWKPQGQIYFVRHGETQVNKENRAQGTLDEPLNAKGRDQIEELRNTSKHLPIDVIVSSDYLRAKQTAEILNADFDLDIEVFEDLREQNFGDYEGITLEDLKKKFPLSKNVYYDVRNDPPHGESLNVFEKRVLSALKILQKKYKGKNILLVAHRGIHHVMRKKQLGIKNWKKYFYLQQPLLENGSMELFETTSLQPKNKLDQWILSELHTLIKEMTEGLDQYDLMKGLDPLVRFIDSLTNWYIRRSRRRFWRKWRETRSEADLASEGAQEAKDSKTKILTENFSSRRAFPHWKSENDLDKFSAYQTLYTTLVEVSKLLAPFAPFISEAMYRNLTGMSSVHLADWPMAEEDRIDEALNQEIALARTIVTLGHAARAKANVKVRQPLSKIEVVMPELSLRGHAKGMAEAIPSVRDNPHGIASPRELGARNDILVDQLPVIAEELNVKEIIFLPSAEGKAQLIVKPNARLLGPKYGAQVQDIIREAKAGHFSKLENGNIKVLNRELLPEEIEIAYQLLETQKGHQVVASGEGMVVILHTEVTAELRREGYARDIIRSIQDLRKQADLNVADRIKVGLTTEAQELQAAIHEFQDVIKKETLAVELSEQKRESPFETVISLGDHGVTVTLEKI